MLTRFAKTTLLLALAVGISLLFARCDSVSTSSPGGEDQQQGALFEATNDLESRMTALDDTVSMRTFGLTDGPQSSKSVQDLSFTGVAQIAPPGDTTRASYLSTAGGQLHVGYKALGPAFKGGIDILDASDPTDILDVSSLGSDNLDVQEVVYDGDEDALFVAAALNPSSYGGDLQGTPSSLIKVTNLSNPQTKVAGLDGLVGKSVVKAPDGDQEHDVYAVTDQTSLYRFDAALENQATQEVQGAEFRSVATTQSTVFTVDRGASVYSSGVGSAGSLSEEQTIASGVGELAIGRMQARSKAVLNGDRLFLALGSEGLAVLDAETGEVLFQKSSPYYTSVSLHTDAPEVSSQPSDLVYASRLDGTIDLFRVGENGIDAGGTDTGLNEFGSLDLGALNPNSSAVAAADASSEVAAANASSKVAGADASNRLDAAASANASSKQVAEQVNYVLAIGCHMYVANSQDGVVVLQIGDGQSCSTDEGNQPPTVNDDTDQTTQGESTTTDVLDNDSDPDGNLDPSTVTPKNGPSKGTVTVNNDGTITYTPDDGFTGEDSYHYSVKDDEGDESENNATVTITVNEPGNQPPTANAETDDTNEDEPTTTDVLANDSDPDGNLDPSTVQVVSGPSDGSVSVDGSTGEITYTPDSGFTGDGSYRYTVEDNDGAESNKARVTIKINAAPTVDTPQDPPNAECFAVTTGGQTTITTDNLSASDPDDDPKDLTFTVTSGPSQGELLLNGSPTSVFSQESIEKGNLEYNHTASNDDNDSFTFDLKDPDGAGPKNVSCNITVESGNQAPTASDDSDQTNEDQPTTTDVLANDNDPDGNLDPSTVQVVSGPSDGSVSVDGSTGEITYTPDTDFTGDDTYTYTVQDNDGAESNEATVTITVQASTAATKGCEGAIGGGVAFTNDGDLKTVASDGGTVNELLITGPDTPVLALGTGVDVDEDGNVGVAYIQQSEGAEQTVSVVDKNDATPTNYALPVAAKSDKTLIGVGSFGGAPSFFYVGAVGNGDEIYRVNFDDGSSEPLADPENGVDAIIGVADVDGDSDKELVFSDGSQQTRYINPGDPSQASFTKLPEGGAGTNNNIGIGSCLADIDGDGRASVPIVDGSNEIDLVDATGVSKTIVTGNANEEAAKTPLAWADIDNDGDPELIYLENNNSPAELKYIDDIAETENFGPSNFKFVENAGGGTIEADTGTGAVSAQ